MGSETLLRVDFLLNKTPWFPRWDVVVIVFLSSVGWYFLCKLEKYFIGKVM